MSVFLETERLVLKKTEQCHFTEIFKLRSDPEVMKYSEYAKPQSQEEVQILLDKIIAHQDKYGFSLFSAFEKSSGDFVGQVGLFHVGFSNDQSEIEFAGRSHLKYWRKGYGTEAAIAIIKWGFNNLDIDKMVAFADPNNVASHHILNKCGMINLGIQNCYYGSLVKYELSKTDLSALISHLTK